MSNNYSVVVSDTKGTFSFDVVATRPAVAVHRALDAYQKERGGRMRELVVRVSFNGKHVPGQCGRKCWKNDASGLRCQNQCVDVSGHRARGCACAEHKG